jgi:hypothetical protein
MICNRTLDPKLGVVAVAGTLALAATVLAAPQADAATLYLCAKHRGGAVRVVSRKAHCHRGETKLSLGGGAGAAGVNGHEGPRGKEGPSGKEGPPGKEGKEGKEGRAGKDGLNGAVAGYFASNTSYLYFTGAVEVTVVSKTIPAGNYLVFGKTVIVSGATAPVRAGAFCELRDNGSELDMSQFTQTLSKWGGAYYDISSLPLQAALSTNGPTTLSIACYDQSADENSQWIAAEFSQIDAIQTTQNS